MTISSFQIFCSSIDLKISFSISLSKSRLRYSFMSFRFALFAFLDLESILVFHSSFSKPIFSLETAKLALLCPSYSCFRLHRFSALSVLIFSISARSLLIFDSYFSASFLRVLSCFYISDSN